MGGWRSPVVWLTKRKHISPTYKKKKRKTKAKREGLFPWKWSAEVKSWGKFPRRSAPLDSFSAARLLFQMWLTHPSLTLSLAWEHRPVGHARHQRPAPNSFFFFLFLSFFLFLPSFLSFPLSFFFLPWQPIIWILCVSVLYGIVVQT